MILQMVRALRFGNSAPVEVAKVPALTIRRSMHSDRTGVQEQAADAARTDALYAPPRPTRRFRHETGQTMVSATSSGPPASAP